MGQAEKVSGDGNREGNCGAGGGPVVTTFRRYRVYLLVGMKPRYGYIDKLPFLCILW